MHAPLSRSLRRPAGSLLAVVMIVPLLAGCPDRTIASVPVDQGTVDTKVIPAVPRREIDILFLIDDSLSMAEEQASLRANFHRFISVLESLDGGLPNVHIGVTTPNLGTSAIDGTNAGALGGCSLRGDGGSLRALPGGGPRFLRDVEVNGVRQRNYTGTLAERFAELAEVGTDGCGIEQHLEAVKQALDGNPDNLGFLRPDAYLAVIVIADEDDCSLAKSSLFAGNASGDPLWGDRVNFRCTQQGVECETPSTDLAIPGLRQDCHPKFDSEELTEIDRYVAFLKGLKADPYDVVVAGIVGDEGPFEIITKANGASVLAPSCVYNGVDGEQFAYPSVRTSDFLRQFPTRATRTTICDGDLSPGLTQIGALLKSVIQDPCFTAQLSDVDPATPGAQYQCAVTEVRYRANQEPEELRVIGRCDDVHTRLPCWTIEEDAATCSYTATNPHLKLVIDRGAEIPAPDTRIKASCVTTAASGDLL